MGRRLTFTRRAGFVLAIGLLIVALGAAAQAQEITSPEEFFGFQLGSDRQMARWDRIVEYYQLLEKQSGGRMKLINMGPSTMGHPFLLAIVSSAENIGKLDRLREISTQLADPRGLGEQQVEVLIAEGKVVICQTMSMHATEIGGSQMAPELTYDLLTRGDEETRRMLDNVVSLIVPSFNPDGQIMVTDWYRKTLDTEYEGSNLPWLYHKYVGHDNNRDAFQANVVESQYVGKILFREWKPQAYLDHHHMGSYGARIYVPPYAEPVRPHGDPLVWREMSWYGAHIAYKEEEAGLSGVINAAVYSGWGHFGFHWITPFHNIAGMLTESANASLATPLYIHPEQLRGGSLAMPSYETQTTFPNPWPGGWWRLRDIVERQKVSAWAAIDLAARNRETVLRNAYLKAKRQTERGAQGKPAAYVIPANQHDRLTAVKMVNKLLGQGIEVMRGQAAFVAGNGMSYPEGSYVVSMAQPKMGLIRYLLGRTQYPDNEWTHNTDGSPKRPYDMSTDTMFEFMGVRVDALDEAVEAALQKVESEIQPAGTVAAGAVGTGGYSFDGRLNDSFKALNRLLEKGVAVRRVDRPAGGLRPGDFVVAGAPAATLAEVAKETGVDFAALSGDVSEATHEVKRLRVGMYQRYQGGNMDEGWTRWLLERFAFPYTSLFDAEIKKGGLNESFDVIILPNDSTRTITGEREPSAGQGSSGRSRAESYPPEYRSGIGEEGVKALDEFVEQGGALLTLGEASNFAIEKLRLDVRNVVQNASELWCPGSTLRVKFDNTHPLAYGMPEEGLAVYVAGNPAFEVIPSLRNASYETPVRYVERDLLESGWLLGEETLANKAAMVAAAKGQGRVVMIGFRAQHRSQTHGTFKLVFNALID
jgi:hypothetical protein